MTQFEDSHPEEHVFDKDDSKSNENRYIDGPSLRLKNALAVKRFKLREETRGDLTVREVSIKLVPD